MPQINVFDVRGYHMLNKEIASNALFATSLNRHHKVSTGGCNPFNSTPCLSVHTKVCVCISKVMLMMSLTMSLK